MADRLIVTQMDRVTRTRLEVMVVASTAPRPAPSRVSVRPIDRLSAVDEHGDLLAYLDLEYCRIQDFLNHPIVSSNFDIAETELSSLPPTTPMTIIGRLDDDRGGVRLTSAAGSEPEQVLRALVDAALGRVSTSVSPAAAPNVPAPQLHVFETGALASVRLHEHRWHALHLDPSLSLEEQLHVWDARTRRTWRKDFEVVRSTGLRIAVESVTPDLVRKLAVLISNVRTRNGMSSHPVMVEYELNAWAARPAGESLAFVCRSSGGNVIGGTLANADSTVLRIRDVGLIDDSDLRSLIYRGVVFAAPLQYAKDEGFNEITLGYGHDVPKRSRGSTSTVMSTVGYLSHKSASAST